MQDPRQDHRGGDRRGVLGTLDAPTALILGRRDEAGRLRIAGRTTGLPVIARREIAGLLRPADALHPWPEQLPAGRFGLWSSGPPVSYVRVAPQLVVEVAADTAFEHGRWRHPVRFARVRSDLQSGDLIAPV